MTNAARKARITSQSVFALGVTVSIGANVMASKHTPIGIAVGLWIPIAFLASMAMLENVPAKGWAGKARFAAMIFIAAIAGWTSYWHLVEVCEAGGADALTSHLLPLTVDVMMALASPGLKRKPAPARRTAAKKAPVRKLKAVA